ncbi:hypothetical protein ECG_05448 [Echinococcus granulosus]|uniref:Pfam-B_2655 domain containing protein n=3 Tax=Echinococcus granulosus TaxID=6210 RepID=A0A068WL09_ECHGR|nr:hypothetical protein ECG_05448 [Echinococcus granulosus]CDS18354.1 Pfam-B_2655 domain containing protein [Echinococcus granulosus]
MNQNLNQISRQMPFGHTDYVPPDETRNFKALIPLADEIKDRLDTKPSIVLKVDSEQYPPELVTRYETEIRENPLPALDYHKLLWGRRTSKYLELSSVYNGSLSPFSNPNKQRRSLGTVQPRRESQELNLPGLESHYRGKAAKPFQVDQTACHLFDQPITLSHAKKLKLRLGNETVTLNDPVFMGSLCNQIRKEIENNEEELSRRREAEEVMRSAAAKKKSRYAVDEYFEAMHLPDLCDQKPWLWTCRKNNRITAECEPEGVHMTNLPPIHHKCPKRTHNPCCFKRYRKRYKKVWMKNSTKKNSSSEEGRSRIFRMDTATSEDLDDEAEKEESKEEEGGRAAKAETAAEGEGEEEEEDEEEEEEEDQVDFYMDDRMSEMKTVANLFANAHGILNNSKEFTNYSITLVSTGEQRDGDEEKHRGEGKEMGYKDGEEEERDKDEGMEEANKDEEKEEQY